MTDSTPQRAFQIAFVLILSLLALLVLGSSISLLFFPGKDGTYSTTPIPVRPAEQIQDSISQTDNAEIQKNIVAHYKNKVDAYTQAVTAYSKEVEAYKVFIENEKVNGNTSKYYRRFDAYKTVINDKLLSLISTIITGIIAWVFAKQALDFANNYFSNRKTRI